MSEPSTDVLLVEDNPGDADLVRLRLVEGQSQANVSCVGRLADGLAQLSEKRPSVVLLDLNLPDSQGAETFRKVLEKSPDVPVVILSGQNDEALAIKALHQGVQDYIVKKDITSGGLARAMRYAMERQALLQSLEMSRKQQLEFKNQFLSHVSHELRTPVTCIHQYATILLDGLAGQLKPDQKEHVNTILRSVNQLNAMVRDLLEATRAESGKLRIEPRCVVLSDVIQQAVSMVLETAREKQVKLTATIDTPLPFALADPDRVLEIFINLLDNAIKFTPANGSVTVQATCTASDPDFIYVTVQDTGCGISPEARPLIFERLYQDPNAADGNRKGLGLGLFITKELVRLHGGRIWVASEAGHGSTFSFTLPAYCLSRLLSPVITYEGKLRDAIVLLRVDLKSKTVPPRGNWKELCTKSLELLQRCVYLDKDVVLPPMAAIGPEQTFYVVASTDMVRVSVMGTRIREQIAKLAEWKTIGSFEISAQPVALPPPQISLSQQVEEVADRVLQMVRATRVRE
ncbi:MAG TPA: hybrid sensor histidine kinase/response regulator [Terriglobales bacterium]|jgi:signal transduction histidine kinase